MLRRPAIRFCALAAIYVPLLSACHSSAHSGAPLPKPPTVVTVKMREYHFDYNSSIPAGPAVFNVVNTGRIPHQMSLIRLDEDVPPIDVQLHGPNRRIVTPFAGVPLRNPGQDGTFAVNLVQGQRYAVICFLSDPWDGQSHALKGMNSEFRAGPPSAKLTIR
jgi:hypothetical protein